MAGSGVRYQGIVAAGILNLEGIDPAPVGNVDVQRDFASRVARGRQSLQENVHWRGQGHRLHHAGGHQGIQQGDRGIGGEKDASVRRIASPVKQEEEIDEVMT